MLCANATGLIVRAFRQIISWWQIRVFLAVSVNESIKEFLEYSHWWIFVWKIRQLYMGATTSNLWINICWRYKLLNSWSIHMSVPIAVCYVDVVVIDRNIHKTSFNAQIFRLAIKGEFTTDKTMVFVDNVRLSDMRQHNNSMSLVLSIISSACLWRIWLTCTHNTTMPQTVCFWFICSSKIQRQSSNSITQQQKNATVCRA